MTRSVLLVAHTERQLSLTGGRDMVRQLTGAGVTVRVLADQVQALGVADVETVEAEGAADGCELVVVLGGDGTLLGAAELARPAGAPLLGVNVGRVGFLAETEPEQLESTVRCVIDAAYVVEERTTLEVVALLPDGSRIEGWALNEAAIERDEPARMLEVLVEVDGRPLSRWGCDGVLCATPTGSTAYAFSAGGPVVWPDVDALLIVPNNAHALFSRPMVVSPRSTVAVQIALSSVPAILSGDGRRTVRIPPGTRIEMSASSVPVRVARTHPGPFTDRLVAKFALPVAGWRGPPREQAAPGS